MTTVFVISLREFLEVFLIIGVFLGISKKLQLKREKEIIIASAAGIIISLTLPMAVFLLGERARLVLTEKNAEILEGYLMIFSGFFIAYVVLSLHKFFVLKRSKTIISLHQKLQENVFDLSLFLTIIFFIVREGFEIALFTSTTILFSQFLENLIGLFLGFAISVAIGLLTFAAYIKFPIRKVFKLTEYGIILLGASFVKNGATELLEQYFDINLGKILPINLGFIPHGETFLGHLIKNISGLEPNFSLAKLLIMVIYIYLIYELLLKKALPRES